MNALQQDALAWAIPLLPAGPEREALAGILADARAACLAWSDASFLSFMRDHSITIPAHELNAWRMLPLREQSMGEIQGLPTLRGRLVATDGVLAYLLNGDKLMLVHLESFLPDKEEVTTKVGRGARQSRVAKQLDELFVGY